MSDLTKLGDDFDIIEVTVDAKEQAEVIERLEQLERHNELLRDVVNKQGEWISKGGDENFSWCPICGSYKSNGHFSNCELKAAIDGGALDEDGDK